MPAPGGAPSGMGGMKPPGGGEVTDEVSSLMGNVGGLSSGNSSSGSQSAPANVSAAQMAAAQQQLVQNGGMPGDSPAGLTGADQLSGSGQVAQKPREVGSIVEEVKRGFGDIFKGIKEFFSLNSWLGIDANKLDPAQQAQAQQVHQRYQQLDQEQQAVARKMYEEKMQKQKAQNEEEARKKQMEAQRQAQSFEMPSGPQKGAKGPSGSKKQKAMTKLKQDRTTLSTTQGE